MTEQRWYINPEGSQFTYKQLRTMLRQNFAFISRASSYTFTIEQTTARTLPWPNKVLRFDPPEAFSKPTQLALAGAGISVNASSTKDFDKKNMRQLLHHEIGHNVGLGHDQHSKYTIMTQVPRFDRRSYFSLLWREDLLDLHLKAPNRDVPVGWCSGDEDFNIMIPAIWAKGEQWQVRLKHYKDKTWRADIMEPEGVNRRMKEKAVLVNGQLHIKDLSYLGHTLPTQRFNIVPSFPTYDFVLI